MAGYAQNMVRSFAPEGPRRRETQPRISLRSSGPVQHLVGKGCNVAAGHVFEALPWSPDRDPHPLTEIARGLDGLTPAVSHLVVQPSEGLREALAQTVAESFREPLDEPGKAVLEAMLDNGSQCFLEWLAGKAIDGLLIAHGMPPMRKITLLLRGASILETLLKEGPRALSDCAASDLAKSATGAGLHHLVNEALLIQGPVQGPQGQPPVYQMRYYALDGGRLQERGSRRVESPNQRDASAAHDSAYRVSLCRRPDGVEFVTLGKDGQPAQWTYDSYMERVRRSRVPVLVNTRRTASDSTPSSKPKGTFSNGSGSLPEGTARLPSFTVGASPRGSRRPKKRDPRSKDDYNRRSDDDAHTIDLSDPVGVWLLAARSGFPVKVPSEYIK